MPVRTTRGVPTPGRRRRRGAGPSVGGSTGAILLAFAAPARGADQNWTNYGGNAARNGQALGVAGPRGDERRWSITDDPAVIAWHPFIWEDVVVTVRESGFPEVGGAANDAIVAYDLDTGRERWRRTLPFGGDTTLEWIAWIGGVSNGTLYASRADHDSPAPIRAYDVGTGAPGWTSTHLTRAWAHDGIVFAPNGDPIVGDWMATTRLDHATGAVVWSTPRTCPVSGACGAAATETAVFIDEAAPGGNRITKLDGATGAVLYQSPIMPGFTDQNTPFLAPDGATVYFSRTQNNPDVDRLYAFEDTGTALVERWSRPIGWTVSHEHAIGPDGRIYAFTEKDDFVALDPASGQVVANAGTVAPLGFSRKTAVDAEGTVYVMNGWAGDPAGNGRLWAFDADLETLLFTVELDRPNAGGPALGRAGTLVVADRAGVHAYRTPATCPADLDASGAVGLPDLLELLVAWGACPGGGVACPPDLDGDGAVGFEDLLALLYGWGGCAAAGMPSGGVPSDGSGQGARPRAGCDDDDDVNEVGATMSTPVTIGVDEPRSIPKQPAGSP